MQKKRLNQFISLSSFYTIIKKHPSFILFTAIFTVFSKFIELISFIVPIKVLLINYSGNIPNFITTFFDDYESINVISIYLILFSIFLYCLYLFFDRINKVFQKKFLEIIKQYKNDINLSGTQLLILGKNCYKFYGDIFFVIVSLLFVTLLVKLYLYFIILFCSTLLVCFYLNILKINNLFLPISEAQNTMRIRLKFIIDVFFFLSVIFIILKIQFYPNLNQIIFDIVAVIILRRICNSIRSTTRSIKISPKAYL